MKRKILAAMLLCCVFFTGCRERVAYCPSVVTGVEVLCRDRGEELVRHYTDGAKLRRVLVCLRQQTMGGNVRVDPERLRGRALQVNLRMSDGSTRIYRQKCGRFQSKDGRRWQAVRQGGDRLYYLLLLMPSDPVAKTARN